MFDGLDPRTRFYFVHSYAVRTWELEVSGPFTAPVVTWAEHGGDRFVAAVENGPLSATQFHQPELVNDMPAGGRRFIQRVDGYEATLVAGSPVFEQGTHTGAMPGHLVRAGHM